MKKKDSRETAGRGRRRGGLTVLDSRGDRQRFLRGMITHDLVLRGLPFDDAYELARTIREHLAQRDEVTTEELRTLVQQELEKRFEGQVPTYLTSPAPPVAERYVLHQGQKQPFSRGVLANSLHAAGLALDRAYLRVREIEETLRTETSRTLTSDEIARRAADHLENSEGPETARRYRLIRRIHRLPRPLVIYIGGASGTGKSTLALELAPLLRIYRITSTDTIRQMMRMVFSPQILPELHSSSFQMPPGRLIAPELEGDSEDRLLLNFEEQAARVAVGVRALVERAIEENMSIVVEGVHLLPPLVPFQDLEGAAYQLPLILTMPDREVHRARFLNRARLGGRRAERYVENFGSIRSVHEHILQQAETYDIPLLDSSFPEVSVSRTLRLIGGLLERRVPTLVEPLGSELQELPPTLMLVIDGLADRPVRALGGRTPLAAAHTPHLDRLAREGCSGLADPVAPGVVPDTAAGSLALFGQSPLALKRGPVEALGAGIDLSPGDIALRANFATLENGLVVDRRAGRIREGAEELAQALDRLPLPGSLADDVELRVRPATEHRVALVLRGEGLSSAILGSDPGEGTPPGPPPIPRPIDPQNPRAVETARILGLFEQRARQVLEAHPINRKRRSKGLPAANTLLSRGAGRIHRLLPLEQAGIPLDLACVSGDQTVLGLARWLGAETTTHPRMTANLDTDLEYKFEVARDAIGRRDLVMLHVKGADIAAHDQRPDLKVRFLEQIDEALGHLLEKHQEPLRIAVAADHATLSESGQHGADPLPVLLWGQGVEADSVTTYDETAAAAGSLGRLPLQMLLSRLFDLG